MNEFISVFAAAFNFFDSSRDYVVVINNLIIIII